MLVTYRKTMKVFHKETTRVATRKTSCDLRTRFNFILNFIQKVKCQLIKRMLAARPSYSALAITSGGALSTRTGGSKQGKIGRLGR
jgi:hypothetical protein